MARSLRLLWLSTALLAGCSEGFQIENGKPAIVNVDAGSGRRVLYIEGADASTFEVIEHTKSAIALYAKDINRVYIGMYGHAMAIENAHPISFRIISPDGTYSADDEHVYFYGVELPEADPKTFGMLEPPYSMDAQHAYVGLDLIPVKSIHGFEVVEVTSSGFCPLTTQHGSLIAKKAHERRTFGWSRDGTSYYWSDVELIGADYRSLKILNPSYAKDRHNVYWKGELVSGADASSFEVNGPGTARGRDKNYEYRLGERTGPRKD